MRGTVDCIAWQSRHIEAVWHAVRGRKWLDWICIHLIHVLLLWLQTALILQLSYEFELVAVKLRTTRHQWTAWNVPSLTEIYKSAWNLSSSTSHHDSHQVVLCWKLLLVYSLFINVLCISDSWTPSVVHQLGLECCTEAATSDNSLCISGITQMKILWSSRGRY